MFHACVTRFDVTKILKKNCNFFRTKQGHTLDAKIYTLASRVFEN